MGLAGAINSAVTGLQAQSTNIAITSDNIANSSTHGYKTVDGVFSTLVTTTEGSTLFSSGGVSITPKTLISQQGLIQSTGNVTDLAISGRGFFAVEDSAENLLLTRAASLTINNEGHMINAAGYTVLGWPLDNDGRLPGAVGNVNTVSADSTSSLTPINTNAASGNASPTTSLKVGMNLNSSQATYQGATVTIAPASLTNNTNASNEILIPSPGMQAGDSFTFTSNSTTPISSTFTYGGFAKSKDLSVQSAYAATSATSVFTTGSNLAIGDKFTITTPTSGTVTFQFAQVNPDISIGKFNSLTTLAQAINAVTGLTARVDNTNLYISSTIATDPIVFADTGTGTLVGGLGLSNVSSGLTRFNTLSGLSALVNAQDNLYSSIKNPNAGATLDIYSRNTLDPLYLTKVPNHAIIDLQSNINGNNSPTDMIIPVAVGSAVTSTMIPDVLGTALSTTSGTLGSAAATISFSDGTNTGTFNYGGIGSSQDITTVVGGIFGATSTTGAFVDGTGGLNDTDTIEFTDGTTPCIVTFRNTLVAASDFNSLATLAQAINASSTAAGSTVYARVANNKLYISSNATTNANAAISVSNTVGITGAEIQTAFGGDFGVTSVTANTASIVDATTTGNSRFSNMQQLNALILGIAAGAAFSTGTLTGNNCKINMSNKVASTQLTIGGADNDHLLAELGVANGAVGDGFFDEMGIATIFNANLGSIANEATIPVTYASGDKTKNMAGGHITPDFSRNIEMYDSLGTGHSFTLGFIKTNTNTWAAEMYAVHPADISNDVNGDGLLVAGSVTFNGDGSLAFVSPSLASSATIKWTTGSTNTTFVFDLGTAGSVSGSTNATVIGLTDGLRQFDSIYNVDFVQQNGVAAGQFTGVTINDKGVISAKFSNGQVKPIYQLPIVTVANQDALFQRTGNVFAITQASGEANLKQAGLGGSGVIVPDALEGSTADIASELTKTISIQANYNANATLISTIKAMEQELNQRL